MRKAYRILAYAISVEVVIQAMAIALAIAGLGKWIEDGATVNKKVLDDEPSFNGSIGFPIHFLNGEMLIPLIAIALLVVSFKAGIPGGSRWAGYIIGLIAIQVALGLTADEVPWLITLHALNAFAILGMSLMAARRAEAVGATTAREATGAAT